MKNENAKGKIQNWNLPCRAGACSRRNANGGEKIHSHSVGDGAFDVPPKNESGLFKIQTPHGLFREAFVYCSF